MKILLVTSFFPPDQIGGTEKRTLGYALRLQERGHEVQVLCAGRWQQHGPYWDGYTDDSYRGVPVRRVHLNWTAAPDPNRYLYCNPIIEQQVGQWLRQWTPDVVHITSCLSLSASVIAAVKACNLPAVLTLTDFWFICPRVNLLRGDGSMCDGRTSSWDCLKCKLWGTKAYSGLNSITPERMTAGVLTWVSKHPRISRARGLRGMALDMDHRRDYLGEMIQAVDCVTAPSSCLAGIFRSTGVSKPIMVIHSGHDLPWHETPPVKKASDRVRIGYIGQVIPIKGVHLLLEAFLKVSPECNAHLSIYGDHHKATAYTRQLENMIRGKEAAVTFHGAFPHERLGEVLAEIDVLVVPSVWHENNPRAVQEAFAAKTPVVASDVCGIAEFVQDGVNGLLFKRDDANDLAQQLVRVITEPGLRDRLQLGIRPVKTSVQEVAELEDIYQDLAKQRGANA